MNELPPKHGAPLISIVFSFRNEEENIRPLLARIDAVFSPEPEDYEAIFVNDDSTDRSLEILLSERQHNPRVRILNMSRRFGVFECMAAGMEATSGDAVIYMDADLQDPPEIIPQLLAKWREGVDVVHTVRRKRLGENRFKMRLTRLGYWAIQFGSSIQLPIEAGDFKLLSRPIVDQLVALKENDPYLRGLVVWLGGKQAAVSYDRNPRHAGLTHFPLFSRNPWKTFALGTTSFSFLPIYTLVFVGLAGMALAGLAGAAAALLTILGNPANHTAWLLGLLTFFWASTLTGIGIVGIYVARTYKDVRGRPRYIVRERVGFKQ